MFLYRFFTSLLYFLLYPLLYIVFIKHNFRERVSLRNLYINESIWIHCASLGEVNAVQPLLKRLLEKYNNKTFILTTVTKTGFEAAKNISGKLIVHQFPLDLSHLMRRFFKAFKPNLIMLVETELWPNLLYQAYKSEVPVIMINARLSKRSYKRFKFFRWFLRKEFSTIKMVCAQSHKDAELFVRLKFNNVFNANNLKFSMKLPDHEMHVLRHAWDYKFNDFIIAFGSSRPGEEAMIRRVYDKLRTQIPRLKIIIAPRHIQRLPEIKNIFKKDEYSIFSETEDANTAKPFMIIDEMGVLPQVYALSDVAIIGGSFYKFGGHNPLEAVWYEKAVIIGEYHSSCIGSVEKLSAERGIIISNEIKLADDILMLYNNIEYRKLLGQMAKKILLDNQDAIEQHWEAIIKWLH
jgi:3-deoxy-D-manno-octulosonic-acid transferase